MCAMRRSAVISVRLAPEEREVIGVAATAAERSLSDYMRLVVLSAVRESNSGTSISSSKSLGVSMQTNPV